MVWRFLFLIILVCSCSNNPAVGLDSLELEEIRTRHNIPGLAVIYSDGSIDKPKTLVAGLRKIGSPEKIQETDKFYLGSVVKSMTALLVAKMVEEGKISFDTTIGDVFRYKDIHPNNMATTIADLLGHRGGFDKESSRYSRDFWDYLHGIEKKKTKTPTEIRSIQSKVILASWPYIKPRTEHRYSNLGYHIAGNLLEKKIQISFEKLLKEKLLNPLKMNSFGFGIAAKEGSNDQPWGHELKDGKYIPDLWVKPLYGVPSGKAHCSLQDVYTYLKEHLLGHLGKGKLLSKESYLKLHTTYSGNKDYGLGWIIEKDTFWHNGSNGSLSIDVKVWPKSNHIVAVASNSSSADSDKAIREVFTKLNP